MQRKQKVFITGASSLLLQHVVALMEDETYEIVGLSRSREKLQNSTIRWCIADLNTSESYAQELSDCDVIIHGAALTHSHNSNEYFRVNVEGTKTLLSSIPEGANPLFIFIGSRVAGHKSGAYGESKLEAEELVKKMARKWVILRPAEVFGGTKNEGIDSTISSSLTGGIKPCPVGVPSKMYPLHVKDAARGIYQAAFISPRENTTHYVNGAVGYSYKELLKAIESATGNIIYTLPVPKFALNIVVSLANMLKVDVGIVPDQVKRLYSDKGHDPNPNYVTEDLADYLKRLSAKNP